MSKNRIYKLLSNVEAEIHEAVQQKAADDGMSMSDYIRHLVIQDLLKDKRLSTKDFVSMAIV